MNFRFIRNVVIKGLLIFILLNLAWTQVAAGDFSRLSLYNSVLRGRERLPFGENPSQAYNLTLDDMDAMLASHKLTGTPKNIDEFRVIVIGDSSTWGTLLKPEETLAGVLDAAFLQTNEGKQVRFYNLGYPTLSLVKDLMLLEQAVQYAPDLILWPVTLESFPHQLQLESPVVANNPRRVNALIDRYHLNLEPLTEKSSLWRRTIIGQRRSLADWLRLQIYGVMWSATGIDQVYPSDYTPALRDLPDDSGYYDWQPPDFPPGSLAFDLLAAGMQIAGEVPVIIINEPILISEGENSSVRYNYYYPRWAYDAYRRELFRSCEIEGWTCLDLWDAVPQEHFTNSAIHRDAYGERIYAQRLLESGLLP